MSVAQEPDVMQLSEAITIYLATGAPFGVYHLFREHASGSRFRALFRAMRAAILWPMAAAGFLLSRQGLSNGALMDKAERADAQYCEKIANAQRQQLASLQKMMQLAQVSTEAERARAERAVRAYQKTIEKYVGLTLAAALSDPEAPPSRREMELCRIAGRVGEDLLLAGHCIHRRNISRLIIHQASARRELLHALTEIRDVAGNSTMMMNARAAQHLSVAAVRFYGDTFNLLSLLEDETAARVSARLIDAECARLRRLEAQSMKETRATQKEGSCHIQVPHPDLRARTRMEASNPQG
jgi:hypothetical protein